MESESGLEITDLIVLLWKLMLSDLLLFIPRLSQVSDLRELFIGLQRSAAIGLTQVVHRLWMPKC